VRNAVTEADDVTVGVVARYQVRWIIQPAGVRVACTPDRRQVALPLTSQSHTRPNVREHAS
jgi:hypothetical protein